MRNDSGGVGGILCPEYFHSEERNKADRCLAKAGSGKIIIPSKSHLDRISGQRKAVKECYCYSKFRKAKVCTKKIAEKPPAFPCGYCRSNFEVDISLPNTETANPLASGLTPFGGETLRRVEQINYAPTSEFLRRVQNKFSSRNNKISSCCELSLNSSSRLSRDSGRGKSALELRCRGGNSGERVGVKSINDTRKDYEIQPRAIERRSITVGNEEGARVGRNKVIEPAPSLRSSNGYIDDRSPMRNDDRKHENITIKPRNLLRKTIRSTECLKDDQLKNERRSVKRSPKRIVRTISAHSRCCPRDDFENFESNTRVNRTKSDCKIEEYPGAHRSKNNWQLSRHKKDQIAAIIGDNEDKVTELKKFRNDNYFETHGSSQNLVASSRSPDSLEQYVLNDRLFPETTRRIHQNDIVVTIPSTATKQRKRIHYFPRHIVKQDKSVHNTNYNRKKSRSQSCSLTGHAIDIGVLKKPFEVSNSLALRYQKGVKMTNK